MVAVHRELHGGYELTVTCALSQLGGGAGSMTSAHPLQQIP